MNISLPPPVRFQESISEVRLLFNSHMKLAPDDWIRLGKHSQNLYPLAIGQEANLECGILRRISVIRHNLEIFAAQDSQSQMNAANFAKVKQLLIHNQLQEGISIHFNKLFLSFRDFFAAIFPSNRREVT